ncbi:GNAT family protein [Marinitoga sp. 38H-ov]|uniref:GNAT family N-acetyltransferase n=1 Tax=Marinitoga sp. 38H-ov TaxID=1755814 RepID=UPI0019D2734A|nr:GNAT family protein [Marinitoga sp. 38H-ov]
MITIYKNHYGDLFFKIVNENEFYDILNGIEKIPKRSVYFFSELDINSFYLNNIGELIIYNCKKELSSKKTFIDFSPDNELIYSILKLLKKSIIPITIWDLVNFYKKGYKIRYLKEKDNILALYIMNKNVVEFMFFEVENVNLMNQALYDISTFVDDTYVLNVYSYQKKLISLLSLKGSIEYNKYKIFKLDGYGIYIGSPQKNDSNKLIEFFEKIFENSETLATKYDEFDKTSKDFEKIIDLSRKNYGLRILVAKNKNSIIGNCDIFWNITRKRLEKTAKLGVSVLEDYRNIGIATTLINNHITWCIENSNIHRLELEVFSNNTKAISLYEKLGFSIEGKRKEAAYINSKYIDILMMGYIVEPIRFFL